MTTSPHPDMPDLQKAFDFTDWDLELNRAGRISQAQVKRAQKDANDYLWMLLIILIPFIPFGACIGLHVLDPRPGYPVLAIAYIGGFLWITVIFFNRRNIIARSELLQVEGVIDLIKRVQVGSRANFTKLSIGNQSFSLNAEQYKTLRENHPYRIYYLNGGVILSVEPLF